MIWWEELLLCLGIVAVVVVTLFTSYCALRDTPLHIIETNPSSTMRQMVIRGFRIPQSTTTEIAMVNSNSSPGQANERNETSVWTVSSGTGQEFSSSSQNDLPTSYDSLEISGRR